VGHQATRAAVAAAAERHLRFATDEVAEGGSHWSLAFVMPFPIRELSAVTRRAICASTPQRIYSATDDEAFLHRQVASTGHGHQIKWIQAAPAPSATGSAHIQKY